MAKFISKKNSKRSQILGVDKSPYSGQKNSHLTHKPSSLPEEDYWLAPKEARSRLAHPTSLTQTESLLDSIFDLEETPEIKHKHWLHSLFTPLGISSLLLILLTNAIGSSLVVLNYKSIGESILTPPSNQEISNSEITNGPNLAQQEFVDLNLLSLSTLPNPTKKSKSDRPKRSRSSVQSPEKSQIKPNKAIVSSPASNTPNFLPGNSETIPSTALANTNYYYILTEYSDPSSLQQVKQKLGNASLVNFPQGLFIYVGAFYDRESANRFVEQLAQQRITAYVHHPE
jgi:hypothetical protein